jgi:hypothetical protein
MLFNFLARERGFCSIIKRHLPLYPLSRVKYLFKC